MTWKEKEIAIRSLEKNGRIDPDDLIHAAKSASHPCHNDFTWDVKKAAAERWRDQARELIRRVHFEVITAEATERVVSYVPNDGDEHQFESLPKIKSKVRAADMFCKELAMLIGMTSRVYGIALAKESMLGSGAVSTLKSVRDTLSTLAAEYAE